jgi:hypothetical protein
VRQVAAGFLVPLGLQSINEDGKRFTLCFVDKLDRIRNFILHEITTQVFWLSMVFIGIGGSMQI